MSEWHIENYLYIYTAEIRFKFLNQPVKLIIAVNLHLKWHLLSNNVYNFVSQKPQGAKNIYSWKQFLWQFVEKQQQTMHVKNTVKTQSICRCFYCHIAFLQQLFVNKIVVDFLMNTAKQYWKSDHHVQADAQPVRQNTHW